LKALLVYPEYPPQTYWSFSGALPYIDRKATLPPLGLLTVAAMLPDSWELRLIDMNVAPLRDSDLLWADVVLTSTMIVQAPSLDQVVARCKRLGVPVVVGGPHPSASPDRHAEADHVFVGEAEGSLSGLIEDLENGRARPLYRAEAFPDVDESPVPRFDLLDLGAYGSMAVQHSRGCPFACEFCDIWKLYGRRSRIKTPERMLVELDALHAAGWSGSVFFVDDNFIGNRRLAKLSLEAITAWQRERGYPFSFYTEASLNLGSDDELMALMRDAGFNMVFLGIETPSVESLLGANKPVNAKVDLLETVRRIQQHGIAVSSGFIVGFDEDTDDIFDRQIDFIRESAIPMAMVGILTALEGTELHARLGREGRLLGESYGNNTHSFEPNFVPRMPVEQLVAGYKRVMHTIYDPTLRNYFERCRVMIERLGPNPGSARPPERREIRAFFRSLRVIPTRSYGRQYLRFLLWAALRHRALFAEAVRLGIQGFHFEGITREALACDDIRHEARSLVERFRGRVGAIADEARRLRAAGSGWVGRVIEERDRDLRRLRRRIGSRVQHVRPAVLAAYHEAVQRLNAALAEAIPDATPALEAGAERLAHLRETLRGDLERFHERHAALFARAERGVAEVKRELRALGKLRREILSRARRRVRQLPEAYRLFGHVEIQALRRNLDDLRPVGVR